MRLLTGLALAASFAAALLTGCTTGFDRKWNSAQATGASDPFAGRWEGTWRSQKHRNSGGQLRCVLSPVRADRYAAAFKANWKVFTSSYSTVFQTERRGHELRFHGSEDLGALFGGMYKFEGHASSTRFSATYDSSYDRGVFEMTKLAEGH